jgi:phosphate/phosphite/phosphonate ABC transporter binding protein
MRPRSIALGGALLGLSLSIASPALLADATYRIGVLAKNGPVKAVSMWKATADYLNEKLPGKTFEVVPLDFAEVAPAVQQQKVNFFLTNSSMYVSAQQEFGASAIATMVNARQGKPLNAFGGVIFTRAENAAINAIGDLKGKSFMAVDKTSFGGWQMAYKELLDAGVDPNTAFSKLEFGGKHENVVLAVLNGAADAGTVRSDTLERMAAEGAIDMADVKLINRKEHPGFPFVTSTPLYPEWPLAKVKDTPDDLARAVAEALTATPAEAKAAKDASVVGWSKPLDYAPVKALKAALPAGLASN